jgi:uncharacterized protein YraI
LQYRRTITLPICIGIMLVLVLTTCQPSPAPPSTLDQTQVAESVIATLTAAPPQPTAIKEAVPTAEPLGSAPEVSPTAVPLEGDPAQLLGQPDGVDHFDNANNWTLFDNQCFSTDIVTGRFVMNAKGIEKKACWTVTWPLVQDYYLQTEIINPEVCQPNDKFGLFFRALDNNRGYLYSLTCDGKFSLTNWNGTTTSVIVAPTDNPVINLGPSAVNLIGVVVYSDSYLLYANGQLLAEAQNSDYIGTGKIGYFVNTDTAQPFSVAYDNMAIWLLNEQYYPPSGSSPPETGTVPTPEPGAATVTSTTYLNVRRGPGTNYPILTTVPPATAGEAIGISADGQWFQVKAPTDITGDGKAWVSVEYVTAQSTGNLPVIPAPPAPPPVIPATVPPGSISVTNYEPINVRSGPSNQYPSYGVAPRGTTFSVLGLSDDGQWYALSIPTSIAPDGVGWVNGIYVVLNTPSGGRVPGYPAPGVQPGVTFPPPETGKPIAIAIDAANVRAGPSNEYDSYGVATNGQSAPAVGQNTDGSWIAVALPTSIAANGVGWVVNSAVQIDPASAQLPVLSP